MSWNDFVNICLLVRNYMRQKSVKSWKELKCLPPMVQRMETYTFLYLLSIVLGVKIITILNFISWFCYVHRTMNTISLSPVTTLIMLFDRSVDKIII